MTGFVCKKQEKNVKRKNYFFSFTSVKGIPYKPESIIQNYYSCYSSFFQNFV